MNMHRQNVDVIAQFNTDGKVIPIRVRLIDEDGARHEYTIKEYREIDHPGCGVALPNGIYVTGNTLIYECKIVVFGHIKRIDLFYKAEDMAWYMSA